MRVGRKGAVCSQRLDAILGSRKAVTHHWHLSCDVLSTSLSDRVKRRGSPLLYSDEIMVLKNNAHVNIEDHQKGHQIAVGRAGRKEQSDYIRVSNLRSFNLIKPTTAPVAAGPKSNSRPLHPRNAFSDCVYLAD